jgi:PAS domain S-box-containing protein
LDSTSHRNWTEADRLAALHAYDILDTEPDPAFEDLARLAAEICEAPTALVSLIDSGRQWFKAAVGTDLCATPLDQSVCVLAMRVEEPVFVVPDLSVDPRFAASGLVTGPPFLRFYAGAPLVTPTGARLGMLCVLDTVPRPTGVTPRQAQALQALARQVMAQMELLRALRQRGEAEARARAEHARATDVLESIGDAFYALDAAMHVTYVNRRAQEIWGLQAERIIGRHFLDVFPQVAGTPSWDVHERVNATREPQHLDLISAVNGRWVTANVYPTPSGGVSVYFRDISEQKAAETRLRELTDTLEERVAERTRQLIEAQAAREAMQEQLRQSQKMEAMGQLTGGIAHDFNNALTGIMGSLELLRTRLAAGRVAEAAKFIDGAMGAAERAASFTQRLLAFARRQTLDSQPTDVPALVASMEDLIRRTTGEAIRVEIRAPDAACRTLCDPNQLEAALLNLIINARDAMPDGGAITIVIGETAVGEAAVGEAAEAGDAGGAVDAPPGRYVCLSVTDTGCGIAPDRLAHVFEPFFTTKPVGQGTGLGLSMLYGFVTQSGGHVRIDSNVGCGTTVRICLPRLDGETA